MVSLVELAFVHALAFLWQIQCANHDKACKIGGRRGDPARKYFNEQFDVYCQSMKIC